MRFVRLWLPILIIVAGLGAMVVTGFSRDGAEGGALIISAGLSVWLLNYLYRLRVAGDRERDAEDEARAFFDAHGHWPDEPPPTGRRPTEQHRKPAPRAHRPAPPAQRTARRRPHR